MRKYKSLQEFFANKKRWVKKTMGKGESKCLLGAICSIYPTTKERAEVIDRLRKEIAIKKNKVAFLQGIISFNDAKNTTIKDIREVCKAANV